MSADWIATYRLQLHAGFPLSAAQEVLPYLAELGISHVYLSPCLQAVPGSAHGYDVADPTRISADLGGEAAWSEFRCPRPFSRSQNIARYRAESHVGLAGTIPGGTMCLPTGRTASSLLSLISEFREANALSYICASSPGPTVRYWMPAS